MAMNGKRLGNLLMEADIITKRQLAQAIQKQTKGDTRKLGEILVEMGYVTVEDLTEVMMEQANRAQSASEKAKRDRLLQKQITKSKIAKPKTPAKPISPPAAEVDAPPELSKDKILNTKFTLSVQTMIGAAVGISSLIGMWYALQADIQEAKELPKVTAIYSNEYPSKASGHNWPSSMEQYNVQVGGLNEDIEVMFETIGELEDKLESLEDELKELRITVAGKRDK